jgi:DNA polymerase III delta prime subunit
VEGNGNFKTIVLLNANELTIDAQSALRRCIELFSHTTRFFIIVQDKYKLLKPILSRLCEIFVYEPMIKGKRINLHKHNLNKTFNVVVPEKKMYNWFDANINPLKLILHENDLYIKLMDLSTKCYEKCYSGLDLMNYIANCKDIDELKKYKMLLVFNKIKKDFRNEKLFILFILNFMLLRSNDDLDNISFM